MYDFEYHRAGSVADAAALIASRSDAKLLAGGMSLIPGLKLRLARYSDLVDLGGISELRGIRREGDALVIGAMTPHALVAASPEVNETIPALASLAEGIGDPLVRNRGTMGGSIAHSDPAADYPAGVVGLGATIMTDQREIAADDFFLGLFETALKPGEIITAVRYPVPEKAAYAKLPQQASRFAIVGVFVAKTGGGVRVAVTGAGASVFRVKAAEAALDRTFEASALDGIEISSDELNSDIHASAEYRAHCVAVMARRAVSAAR
jgi:aerobic carbon-monoxide dehydrogenase medium subunit